jgi:hypothetical protein
MAWGSLVVLPFQLDSGRREPAHDSNKVSKQAPKAIKKMNPLAAVEQSYRAAGADSKNVLI